jgi:glycosyltransferase involved in cell wall biosynthesis
MKRICAIAFSHFPEEIRTRRETEALAEAGYHVDLICLRQKGQMKYERLNGITVYRISVKRCREGRLRYIWQYSIFTLLSFVKVTTLYIRRRYSIVHVHNMPDILIFSSLVPRILKAKVILDLHDPMPELYMTKYGLLKKQFMIKFLIFLEKLSCSFAHMVITPNISFARVFVSRSCKKKKMNIIMNTSQESIFFNRFGHSPQNIETNVKTFRLMFHGTIVERHGLSFALHAINAVHTHISNIVFDVYGDGDVVREFLRIRGLLKLDKIVNYHGTVSIEHIADAIQSIDAGLIPNIPGPFTQINLPTRIFEYLSFNKPVVAPRMTGIQDYFDEDSIFYFEPGNIDSLAGTIVDIYTNPIKRQTVIENGRNVYNKYQWKYEKLKLISCFNNLID